MISLFFVSFTFFIILLFKYKNHSSFLFLFFVAFLFWTKIVTFEEISLSFFNKNVLIILMLSIFALVFRKLSFISNLKNIIKKNDFNFIFITGFLSSFLNNITVMSTLINTIEKNKRNLIFLSFLTILGGTTTLIGTSTNLVANQIVQENTSLYLGFKHFFIIGIPTFLITSFSLYLFLKYFKFSEIKDFFDSKKYFIEATVEENSFLIGKTVKENKLRNLENLYLAEILRNDEIILVEENTILESNDILIFVGDTSKISELSLIKGLKLFNQNTDVLKNNLIEVIISPDSKFINYSVKEISFRKNYGLPIVAVKRNREKVNGKIGDLVLEPGDTLILATDKKDSEDYTFLNDLKKHEVFDLKKSLFISFGFFSVLILNLLNIVGLFNGLLVLIFSFMLFNIISVKEIKKINMDFLLIIASGLVIAKAFTNLGIDKIISNNINLFVGPENPFILVLILFLLTLLVTEIFSNAVAVSLSLPIAISMFSFVDNPYALLFSVVFAANASFIFPYGYHTNLIAFTTGKFSYKEFMTIGLFTTLVFSISVLFFIYIFYII